MKHFLDLSQIDKAELREILNEAKKIKKNYSKNKKVFVTENSNAIDKLLLMIFEKPSTRTRISFDIAVKQLGGSSIILNPDGVHYGKGDETIIDTAKVLSEYADIIMMRTNSHKNLEEFGKHSTIPVINGLSEKGHPCQIMSDILTFEEAKGNISGKTISWIGDGNNNMSNSLIEAASKFNFKLKIGCPSKYKPAKKIMLFAKKNKVKLEIYKDPRKAVKDTDCVMTDKWVSMNDNVNKKKKKKDLKNYQVNKKLMVLAKKDAIFMHCLPVSRGEEVTDEIIDGEQSIVWTQALNRVHAQKSIIKWCLS